MFMIFIKKRVCINIQQIKKIIRKYRDNNNLKK